jgi:hypothetical protein
MNSAPGFGPVTPVIPADDVGRSLSSGEPVNYAGLRRGLATLHLFACSEPNIARWTAFRIGVDEIELLFEHAEAAGIVHPGGRLGVRPWGSREFTVLDPSGVGITFWQRMPP